MDRPSSSPRTAGRTHLRRWSLCCLVVLLSVAGCEEPTAVGYKPPLLPIEISIDSDGDIELRASPEIATPVGTFSLQQSLSRRKIASSKTLLIIRKSIRGIVKDHLIKINSSVKMTFLLNGEYAFRSQGNVAVLQPHRGVSGIRVQRNETQEPAPRITAERVTTLPTPPVQPTPTEPITCPTEEATLCPVPTTPGPTDPATPVPITPPPAPISSP